jgi:hypothetical protein
MMNMVKITFLSLMLNFCMVNFAGPSKIGTVSDLVSTLIFVLGVGALMYLMIKLFCNW